MRDARSPAAQPDPSRAAPAASAPAPPAPSAAVADALRRFLARRVPDPADAEEVAQEVWARWARARPDCPSEGHLHAWVVAVARRLLIDRHRRQLARPVLVPTEHDPIVADPTASPESTARAAQIAAVVGATLDGMKPELADVFRWRTTSDVPFAEIAERQGCSVGTALSRMHQATGHLRRALLAAGLLEAT
jgi:RNA polymerase sigma-70 factor (ECF subfamily)